MSAPHRIHLAETDSTNRYARECVAWHDVATLVTTDHQTAGRGQRGNSWESEAGKNLLFTIVLPTRDIKASEQFVVSELIAVAISEVLSRHTADIRIKWPNDIYYRDQKMCGILIEHDIEGSHIVRSLIGVGLNVNQTRFVSDAPNPISLVQILGYDVEREPLLQAITARFIELYEEYTSPTPTLSRDALHQRYTQQLYRRDTPAEYRDHEGSFTAVLRHVEPDGRLVLEDEQGILRKYLFKEVAYII